MLSALVLLLVLLISSALASQGPNALHDAVVGDDLDALQAALKAGASTEDRDALGYTVLMRAADDGAIDAAKELLAAGALTQQEYEGKRDEIMEEVGL